MSCLMTVGHRKSPRGCVRYIPSEHMFILVTSPTYPAIFGRNPHREPETARPYSPTLPVDAYSPQSKALRNRLFSQSCINPLVKMPRGLKSSLQNHYSQHCSKTLWHEGGGRINFPIHPLLQPNSVRYCRNSHVHWSELPKSFSSKFSDPRFRSALTRVQEPYERVRDSNDLKIDKDLKRV